MDEDARLLRTARCRACAFLRLAISSPRRSARCWPTSAQIIKIEPPAGDPVRQWGKQVNGVAPWWSLHARNKRCITLN